MKATLTLVVCCWAAVASATGEERLVIEETFLSVEIKGQPYKLEALVMKEVGGGRRPVAIITHGQARDAEKNERLTPRIHLRTAREFARRGWLAVVVVRRGFGRSEGKQRFFTLRGCRDGDYAIPLDERTDDIEAAIKVIGRRLDADIGQIIALGQSYGGATVLNLAARNPNGLRAVINVAGGIRTLPGDGGPPVTCKPEDLVTAFARMGERSRIPPVALCRERHVLSPRLCPSAP